MPFPRYGSGGFTRRTFAANCPTDSLFGLVIVILFFSTVTVMSSGIASGTVCEKPTVRTTSLPLTSILYPTPSSMSFFIYGVSTPCTIFLTCEANVPVRDLARRELFFGVIITPPSPTATSTEGCTRFVSVPLVPFTERIPLSTETAVFPTDIGFLASRLIITKFQTILLRRPASYALLRQKLFQRART